MDFVYRVPEDLKHFDHVRQLWDDLTNENRNSAVSNIIENVVNWWEMYPQKNNKIVIENEVPRNVWKILEKFKITHTEKIYGIYYTLEYILDERMCLEINSIQFNTDGRVDTAVIIEDFMICDGNYYDIASVEFTVLNVLGHSKSLT